MVQTAKSPTAETSNRRMDLNQTISIDIGGTFTDCYVYRQGKPAWGKALTTRHRLDVGFDEAISECASHMGVPADDLIGGADVIRYATTLAMNALIERKGPRLALLTTAGFEDTIYIGRGAQWHDGLPLEAKRLTARGHRPEPLLPRQMVQGLTERIDDDGSIVIKLNPAEVREKLRTLVDRGAMGFVIVLLHSYRNPVHEEMVRDIIYEEFPDVYLGSQPVLLSSEVWPQQNEYQRNMTTLLAAYLHRTMAEELTQLGNSLSDRGYKRPLFIVNSGGGAKPLQRTSAVNTYNAGPVAGVIGGAYLGQLYGAENLILTDMGGTSFDIGTVVELGRDSHDGDLRARHFYSHMPMIDRFRVGISMIETQSIGAGGGSIAKYNDLLRLVEVGPESAGSNPGPAAFDLGGDRPTVTDADVVLGYIDPDYFLGGQIALNKEAAESAIREHLADPLKCSVEEAAFLVKSIIDAKMGNEIFKETNLKGYDPRDFTLFAYGGGGPAHACGYGSLVGVERIMTFPFASVFSAFGIANTDFRASYDGAAAVKLFDGNTNQWLEDFKVFNNSVASLQKEALRDAHDLGVKDVLWSVELYMRYGHQPHLTRVQSPRIFLDSADDVTAVYDAFEEEYSRVYSRAATYLAGGVEISGITLWSTIPTTKVELPVLKLEKPDASHARKVTRPTFWGAEKGWIETPVYENSLLKPGNRVEGPAIIEAVDTTIVLDDEHDYRIDERTSGLIEKKG